MILVAVWINIYNNILLNPNLLFSNYYKNNYLNPKGTENKLSFIGIQTFDLKYDCILLYGLIYIIIYF
jgi:hypothetical protein